MASLARTADGSAEARLILRRAYSQVERQNSAAYFVTAGTNIGSKVGCPPRMFEGGGLY